MITERGIAGKSALPIIGKRGVPGPPGDSSLTIKNTAFVSKNGNDSTALVERLDKPYATIQSAINAIAAAYPSRTVTDRKQVIVFAGYYTEDVAMKQFVDVHFYASLLDGSLSDGNIAMTAVSSDQYTNIITGDLRLHKTNPSNVAALAINKPTSKFLVSCVSIGSSSCDAIAVLNGLLTVKCQKIYCNDTASNFNLPIELAQGIVEEDYSQSIVEIIGADIFRGAGGKGPLVSFSAGDDHKNQTLVLRDCRLKNTQDDASADNNACIATGNVLASNARIALYNTTMYSANGTSIYTSGTNVSTVKCYHSNMSNKNSGGPGTTTFALGAITVNAAVEAEF